MKYSIKELLAWFFVLVIGLLVGDKINHILPEGNFKEFLFWFCCATVTTRALMIINKADKKRKAIKLTKNLVQLEEERMKWSLRNFPEATAESSLLKLLEEVQEIQCDLMNDKRPVEEYVDGLMCILDSAGRRAIYLPELIEGYERKLEKNKARKWVKNDDNTYSHIK